MKVTGQVVTLSNKTISPPGKRPFKVHYVELDNGKVINVGFKQPFDVGQTISVDCEMAYGELKMGAPPASSGAPGSAPATKTGGGGYKNDKFPVPITHGDYAIIRQNALTNAVTMWTTTSGATKGMVNDEDVEAVIKIAYKFADFTSGHREEKLAKDMGKRVAVVARDDAA